MISSLKLLMLMAPAVTAEKCSPVSLVNRSYLVVVCLDQC
jgi:hypothetical protein